MAEGDGWLPFPQQWVPGLPERGAGTRESCGSHGHFLALTLIWWDEASPNEEALCCPLSARSRVAQPPCWDPALCPHCCQAAWSALCPAAAGSLLLLDSLGQHWGPRVSMAQLSRVQTCGCCQLVSLIQPLPRSLGVLARGTCMQTRRESFSEARGEKHLALT